MYAEAPTYTVSFYFRKILVPIDGSESAYRALEVAADLARHYGSRVIVIYVKPKGAVLQRDQDPIVKAKERLRSAPLNLTYKYLEYDPTVESPSSVLVKEISSEGYDLVVIGARGKTLLSDLNIGSTALSLVVNSATSLFIVR
ncbi:MAG: universal stress protein [Desulfurococcaceae archaeon]|nr:universal stress protein [Desulfurococcaceae archaeon]